MDPEITLEYAEEPATGPYLESYGSLHLVMCKLWEDVTEEEPSCNQICAVGWKLGPEHQLIICGQGNSSYT